ncbi:hypothetical protein [Bacteroidetes bacterium endosymbiont of Geopemphigus sp.]|uniref:hypothetical protein n=1 Tax=Bacteroidetes bacterium endosymbiont of Geopemphigus sp. TaxID=2047937 RepID=UPI0011AFA878|nr:hypothetical protein [Bacteroidetes bacterium endosymbiont of Geopemphigus sp.]
MDYIILLYEEDNHLFVFTLFFIVSSLKVQESSRFKRSAQKYEFYFGVKAGIGIAPIFNVDKSLSNHFKNSKKIPPQSKGKRLINLEYIEIELYLIRYYINIPVLAKYNCPVGISPP